MNDIERRLLEAVGASEEDVKPKDRVGELEARADDTDDTLDDVVLMIADIIGGM